MSTGQRSALNLLLRALSPDAFEAIEPFLQRVKLKIKHPLEVPGTPIHEVYFPETFIGSRVATAGDQSIEVGLSGNDGFTGVPVVHHATTSQIDCYVQIPGEAFRISTTDLQGCIARVPEIGIVLLRYSLALMDQVSHTALANGRFTVPERMSRWILMCHDRSQSDEINLTHEFLALMMGVRRAGITVEVHVLEGEHAIRNTRGRIIVTDRQKLVEIAGDCYGPPEAEYERLIGQRLRRDRLNV